MLVIAVAMLAIVLVAALVVTFVAFPHRGQQVPAAPWLGDVMARAASAAPVIDPDDEYGEPGSDARRHDAGLGDLASR